jgi:hypothetical protein
LWKTHLPQFFGSPTIRRLHLLALLLMIACAVCLPARLLAQTGSVNEPVRYIGGVTIHRQAHDPRPPSRLARVLWIVIPLAIAIARVMLRKRDGAKMVE